MKRIPRHVITRNRNAVEAERNAQFYARPAKAGGACQLCGEIEDDHFAGMCEDFRSYVPPVGKCIVEGCNEVGAVRDTYFVCPAHLAEVLEAQQVLVRH